MSEFEKEQTFEETIAELLENKNQRYILIGDQTEVKKGLATIYDSSNGNWISISSDETARKVIAEMFLRGAKVIPQLPRPVG